MDTKKTISEQVMTRIEAAQATPKSRVYFILKNTGIWFLAILSIVLGALATASIMFRLVNAGPALRPGNPPISEVILIIPFIWIVCVGIFGYLAYREIRSTRRGYRYEFSVVLLGLVLASLALGLVFYSAGTGFSLDRIAAQYLPFHTDLERIQRDRWMHPEDGFLVGVIREETAEGLILTDPENIEWTVFLSSTISEQKLQNLAEGQRIGVRGNSIDIQTHTFLACDIRSLEFEGRGFQRPMTPKGERKVLPPRTNGCEDVRPLD